METSIAMRGKQQRGMATRESILQAAGGAFARAGYADARLKDIAQLSGIALGSVYFHFGNKDDLAAAVLEEQRSRMTRVLLRWLDAPETALCRMLGVLDGLARLIAEDALVQGGLRLSGNLPEELSGQALVPHVEMTRVARAIISAGIEDGSMHRQLDVNLAAEFLSEMFVGCEVISGATDRWASLPGRIRRLHDRIREVLSPPPAQELRLEGSAVSRAEAAPIVLHAAVEHTKERVSVGGAS